MNELPAVMKRQATVTATRWVALAVVAAIALWPGMTPRAVTAQSLAPEREAMAEAARAAENGEAAAPWTPSDTGTNAPRSPEINLLELLVRGGWLMWPIGFMSLLVVTFGLERSLGLRSRRVLPLALVHRVRGLLDGRGTIRLETVAQLCDHYPSSTSRVIHSALRKADRPLSEIEHAVRDACEREASRLYANVRWLSLAAAMAPLLGLLGTVWGMIQAFFATANLPAGANKADCLAEGIYVALVTTFAGLAVAIPAGVLAHLFEGRIQRLFRNMNELIEDLLPRLAPCDDSPATLAVDGRLAGPSLHRDARAVGDGRGAAPPIISRPPV